MIYSIDSLSNNDIPGFHFHMSIKLLTSSDSSFGKSSYNHVFHIKYLKGSISYQDQINSSHGWHSRTIQIMINQLRKNKFSDLISNGLK